MRKADKAVILLVSLIATLMLFGCAKKTCVKPVGEEPVVVEPPAEIEEVETGEPKTPPTIGLNLQTIYFDFDRFDIRPSDAQTLEQNANQIKKALNQGQNFRVTIEGYCCPIGTAEYNMALGLRRAETAKAYLIKLGVNGTILNTVSYGEERLVTTDSLEYHLNRRCEFKTVGK